jgi:hypothetical protein
MTQTSTPVRHADAPRRHQASLLGRAVAGFSSILDVFREVKEMRRAAQRRYPSMES